MPSLGGTKTEQNLKDAFAGESQAWDSPAKASLRFCSVLVPPSDGISLSLIVFVVHSCRSSETRDSFVLGLPEYVLDV